jgi:hypothetical protein
LPLGASRAAPKGGIIGPITMRRGPVMPWCNILARCGGMALISIAMTCGRSLTHGRAHSSTERSCAGCARGTCAGQRCLKGCTALRAWSARGLSQRACEEVAFLSKWEGEPSLRITLRSFGGPRGMQSARQRMHWKPWYGQADVAIPTQLAAYPSRILRDQVCGPCAGEIQGFRRWPLSPQYRSPPLHTRMYRCLCWLLPKHAKKQSCP